jgi:hypothetical protein
MLRAAATCGQPSGEPDRERAGAAANVHDAISKSKLRGPTVEQPHELRPQRHDDHEIDDVVNCTVASVSRSNSSCGARAECESGAASETQMAAATSGEID